MLWVSDDLRAWLAATRTANGSYLHLLLVEAADGREKGLEALGVLVANAHEDAEIVEAAEGFEQGAYAEVGVPHPA